MDVKRLKLEKEMSSITVISQIEKLIPPIQLREWVILKQRSRLISSEDQFEPLLQFLVSEKEAMEYISGQTITESKTVAAKTNNLEQSTISTDHIPIESSGILNRIDKQEERME